MSVSVHAPEVIATGWSNRGNERSFVAPDFSVIREMLGTLETLTTAGQHHIMDKIVDYVRGQARRAAPHVSRRNQEALAVLVANLQRESERLVADLGIFTRGAESLIVLLGSAT